VELLNLRLRSRQAAPVKLHGPFEGEIAGSGEEHFVVDVAPVLRCRTRDQESPVLREQGDAEKRSRLEARRHAEDEAAAHLAQNHRGLDVGQRAVPMQLRGPPPKGRYANRGSSSMKLAVHRRGPELVGRLEVPRLSAGFAH
jgi:hypothetical protein